MPQATFNLYADSKRRRCCDIWLVRHPCHQLIDVQKLVSFVQYKHGKQMLQLQWKVSQQEIVSQFFRSWLQKALSTFPSRLHHGNLPRFVGFRNQLPLHGRFHSYQASFACRACAGKQELVAHWRLLLWASRRCPCCKACCEYDFGRSRATRWICSSISSRIWWSGGPMGSGKARLGDFHLWAKAGSGNWCHLVVQIWSWRRHPTKVFFSFFRQHQTTDCNQGLALCIDCMRQCGISYIEIDCGNRIWCTVRLCSQWKFWCQQLSCDAC